MEEDRMRFSRVRPPKNDQVGFLNLLIRVRASAGSENRRQTGDAWSVSGPVAAIDVVAAHDGSSELLGEVIQLVGRL